MVVVNANATGAICIWRFNRFRAKLCYRAFYLYAVLGRNIRLPDDRHESCCQARALYREREITGPARPKSQSQIPIRQGGAFAFAHVRCGWIVRNLIVPPYFRALIENP